MKLHVFLVKSSDPIYDQNWLESINNMKIPFKGDRNGYCIPFGEEIKFYQFRVKEECAPEFLARVRAIDIFDENNALAMLATMNGQEDEPSALNIKKTGFLKKFVLKLGIKCIKKLLKFVHVDQVTKKEGDFPPCTKGHALIFNVGVVKDIKGDDGEYL